MIFDTGSLLVALWETFLKGTKFLFLSFFILLIQCLISSLTISDTVSRPVLKCSPRNVLSKMVTTTSYKSPVST